MNVWKFKLIAMAIAVIILAIVQYKVNNYWTVIKEGALDILICVGEVDRIDTSETVDQILTLRVLTGPYKGDLIEGVENKFIGQITDRILHKGEKLFLEMPIKDGRRSGIYLREHFRVPFLGYLAFVFVGVIILVGGGKGIRALAALAATMLIFLFILAPLVIRGYNPVWIAVAVCALATLGTFLLVAGFSRKMIAGSLGALGGLISCAILSMWAVKAMNLTSVDQDFGFLNLGTHLWRYEGSHHWDFSGILAAGMIIGALGAIMDIGIVLSSAVEEVKRANPNISVTRAIQAGINVGKDSMGTMADTLIFAYMGADLYRVLIPSIEFEGLGKIWAFPRLLNYSLTAGEVAQILAGSIGLFLTVPITALIAGLLSKYYKPKPEDLLSPDELPPELIEKPKEERRKWLLLASLAVIALIFYGGSNFFDSYKATVRNQKDENGQITSVEEYVKGKVLKIHQITPVEEQFEVDIVLEAELLGGTYKGQKVIARNIIKPSAMPNINVHLKEGDKALFYVGGDTKSISLVVIKDYDRDSILMFMFGLFVLLLVLIARNQGLRNLLTLAISISAVFFVMVPLMERGKEPIIVVSFIALIITAISRFILVGFHEKSYVAVLGTVGGVVAGAILVLIADHQLRLTGISHNTALEIANAAVSYDFSFKKVLMAGMLLGVLGAGNDVAIDVASSMYEVRSVNPRLGIRRLIASGMTVGTDLMGTMINTLIFAYFGLRLLMAVSFIGTPELFSTTLPQMLSIDTITEELVRGFVGTIGLALIVPITAIIAGVWYKRTE